MVSLVKRGFIKREIEVLIFAQEQVIRMNTVMIMLERAQKESKYRICGQADKTAHMRLDKTYSMILAQKEYKQQHDWKDNIL